MRTREPSFQIAEVSERLRTGSDLEWRRAYNAWLKRRKFHDRDWQTKAVSFSCKNHEADGPSPRTARGPAAEKSAIGTAAKIRACAARHPVFTKEHLAHWYGGNIRSASTILSLARRRGWIVCARPGRQGRNATLSEWKLAPSFTP